MRPSFLPFRLLSHSLPNFAVDFFLGLASYLRSVEQEGKKQKIPFYELETERGKEEGKKINIFIDTRMKIDLNYSDF